MFPFNLPGPQFLLFYVIFAVAVMLALYFFRRRLESVPHGSIDLNDPYLFACLRSGPKEVLSVAMLGLIDRGLLTTNGNVVAQSPNAESGSVRRRVDKEVIGFFKDGTSFDAIYDRSSAAFRVAQEDYENQLRRHRLIPDDEILRTRRHLVTTALAALIGVALIKIGVAVEAGRSNIWFLIIMMVVASIVALMIYKPYRTAAGDSQLENIRSMFSDLRRRASSIQSGTGSRELMWLTALYGATAVPLSASPFASIIQRGASRSNAGYYSSGCGSGGGSSGCGGGGGGCGGCGGG